MDKIERENKHTGIEDKIDTMESRKKTDNIIEDEK